MVNQKILGSCINFKLYRNYIFKALQLDFNHDHESCCDQHLRKNS